MFGYVNINKLELKFKEYYRYKGYYCGLCMSLKNNYGNLSRMTLNYDITFLVLLLSALYEIPESAHMSRCISHPTNKQMIIENDIIDYAAAMNILLSYYKMVDDWQDDKSIKSKAFSIAIKGDVKKAREKFPDKANIIEEQMKKMNLLEKERCSDINIMADQFGIILENLIIYKKDNFEKYLRKIGFELGRYIYILDAYMDYEEDIKSDSYNPLLLGGYKFDEKLHDYVDDSISQILEKMTLEIDKLPILRDINIIDNIVYSGILIRYNEYRKKIGIKGKLSW